MKIVKRGILYAGLMMIFGGLIFFLLRSGPKIFGTPDLLPSKGPVGSSVFFNIFQFNVSAALPRLLLQIVIIIFFTRLLGYLFRKISQPAVIGEIVAGIVLGPSLLGWLFPAALHFVFPVESMMNLQFLSQMGLILFMFIVGMELDTGLLRKQAFEAVIISHASIIIPFFLGICISYYLYGNYSAPENQYITGEAVQTSHSFISFALFMGIAMSITAFPVLARIIRDRKLTDTPLGILAIGCAASDDVTAWCILAVLIAWIRSGSGSEALIMIGWVVFYVFVMLVPVRMILRKIQQLCMAGKMGNNTWMAVIFTVLLLSAWSTEVLGIHALFGAFVAGIIIPKNDDAQKKIIGRIGDLTMVMLLPLFFVYSGLRTQVGLLNSLAMWSTFALILLCAIAGKFAGSALVAKALGQSWKNSLSIGALMNTRGLMELIVLNIGYDMGILSAGFFSMMVLMALVTTLMTSPLLNWIGNKV
jgi:Kef-type K+ transport system membrane component KefB